MQRYMQFTVSEPIDPTSTIDERIQIESAVIGIDLHTGHVTLPGGFVCSLGSLVYTVDRMRTVQRNYIRSGRGPWRTGKT